MKRFIPAASLILILSACMSSIKTPTPAGSIDLASYAGRWYEIASYPAPFQKGCHCTTAEYLITGKRYIRVINRCRRDSADGKLSGISGRAYPVEGTSNTRLRVQFFWPFRGDYSIQIIAPDYSWAVVSSGKKYLWILSRTPVMDESTYNDLLARIAGLGFDTAPLVRTFQQCP